MLDARSKVLALERKNKALLKDQQVLEQRLQAIEYVARTRLAEGRALRTTIKHLKSVWETDGAECDLRELHDGTGDFCVSEYHRLSAAPETTAWVDQNWEDACAEFKKK
jgi:hypothetical protein